MGEKRDELKKIRGLAKEGKFEEAHARLTSVADPWDDFPLQMQYAKILKSLCPDRLHLRPIRVAILGSSTLEHFVDVLCFWLACEGLSQQLYIAPFDTIRQSALDPTSDLYAFNPEIIWMFSSHRDVFIDIEHGQSPEILDSAVTEAVNDFAALWDAMRQCSSAYIIQNNADLPTERTFGNYEGAILWGRSNLLRRFNLELSARMPSGSTIFDLEHVSSLYGKYRWEDPRYWFHSKHAFSLDASGLVAFHAARLIGAMKGTAKKCIVLDLDDTLWGGVIGDDGLNGIRLGNGANGEAFVAFQEYLKGLKNRGIVLAVCSKNEEGNAKEPFMRHPDMRLSLDDISVFKANWENKPDNIREIAAVLNIGLDSLVFVDDNPLERDLVRSMLPMVTVPEMPDDPAEYIRTIDRLRLFETVSFSEEDKDRSRLYKENAVRHESQRKFSDLSDYLKSLRMEAAVGSVDDFHIKRMAQLINKSNQFHLTGTRYAESEIERMNAAPLYSVRYFKLKDKFGDNGLISVVIMKREQDALAIDTWVMSCRVLSRGMEEFICKEVLTMARRQGCRRIVSRYVPSKKNQLVAGLYEKLQFQKTCEENDGTTHWEFDLENPDPDYDIHIRQAKAESGEAQVYG